MAQERTPRGAQGQCRAQYLDELAGKAKPPQPALMKDWIITVLGPDQKGLVAELAEVVSSHGGNWLDCRLIELGGVFSGLVRIALPEATEADCLDLIAERMGQRELQVQTIEARAAKVDASSGSEVQLQISGQDHPGIVRSIFRICLEHHINVSELTSGCRAEPWSGSPVFHATARLTLPQESDLDTIQAELEALASDLLVELEFKS
jgi:glycine cleavage system regulatory protein